MQNLQNEGCVYFIKHKGIEPIKIGYSMYSSPKDRVESFNTSSPYGIELLGFIVSMKAKELETKLHEKYKCKRLNGEWFDITVKDVQNELLLYNEINIEQKLNDYFRSKLLIGYNKKKLYGFTDNDEMFFIQIQTNTIYYTKDLNNNYLNLTKNKISDKLLINKLKLFCENKELKLERGKCSNTKKRYNIIIDK